MKNSILLLIIALAAVHAKAQVYGERDAVVYLGEGSQLAAEGAVDISSAFGDGELLLTGNEPQRLNLHGATLNRLTIANPGGVSLDAPLTVLGGLQLQQGRLQLFSNTLELGSAAAIAGGSADAYIETNGNGQVKKLILSGLEGYVVPLGDDEGFAPVLLKADGRCRNAFVTVATRSAMSAHRPAMAEAGLQRYWPISRHGIAGTVVVSAVPPGNPEQGLKAHYWNGSQWQEQSARPNVDVHSLSAVVPEGAGELSAFLLRGDRSAEFSVWPNPAVNTVSVTVGSLEETATVLRVLDLQGRTVLAKKINLLKGGNRISIDVGRLARGSYTVQLPAAGVRHVRSFVKE